MSGARESISVFDIFKIGVGPSSSHTVGPWKAAQAFIKTLTHTDFDRIEAHLFGSLSKTGKGHATDIAIQLGLEDFSIESIDTEKINDYIRRIKTEGNIRINGKEIPFDADQHIFFEKIPLSEEDHPNTLIFKALHKGKIAAEKVYFSVGGGFIICKGEEATSASVAQLPYPISLGDDIIRYTDLRKCRLSDIVYENERYFRKDEEIDASLQAIFNTMLKCVYDGCRSEGILPGGLGVKKRAKHISESLLKKDMLSFSSIEEWIDAIRKTERDFQTVNQWVSCFALAANEQNAMMGKVVTSPTNGAAGVIPAVLLYFYLFFSNKGMEDIKRFLFAAGEIGSLFKKGATISAAVGGCQAEIGVSSAMAAAGLAEVFDATPDQALMAAEIAMEHHLGLTCDPIAGLVQVPCIERNAMGAIKAITACNLALSSDPKAAIVKFDTVVKTMWATAKEMNAKYKETSEGGLATNFPVNLPDC